MARRLQQRGVTRRTYASGRRAIQLAFSYRGVECREVWPGDPNVVDDWNQAVFVYREIQGRIARNAFRYSSYFPDSKRVAVFEGPDGHNPTFKAKADAWLDLIARSVEETALRKYKGSLQRFWGPELDHKLIADIVPRDIRGPLTARTMTLKTMRNHMTPLRGVIDLALEDEDIDRDPLTSIKLPRLVSREAKSDYKVDPWTMAEIRAMVEACRQHRPGWLNYLVWQIFTGLRPGESYFLKWAAVDWLNTAVRVEGAVTDKIVKRTKTEASERDHELLPAALAALKAQRAVTGLADGHVWLNPRTGEPLLTGYDATSTMFDYVQKRAGVRRRRQYQARHTYASHMLSCGENPLRVAKLMGHKNTEMIFKTYGRWVEQDEETGFLEASFHGGARRKAETA